MPQYNLFSISLISAGLALFYTTSLSGLSTRMSSLPGFIGSFIRAPRFVPPVKMGRGQGFSYVAELDVDTIDIRGGVSPFVVLEDGKPLAGFPVTPLRPEDKANLKNVCNHGKGRYVHVGRQIIFSPSDNADQGSRQYLLLETLTRDTEKLRALLAVNKQRDTADNIGAWLLAKLQIYAGDLLTIGQTDATAPAAITLNDVQVNLEQYGLFQVRSRDAAIRWTADPQAAWNHVTFELRGLEAAGLPGDSWITCRLAYSKDCRVRLEQLDLGQGAATWLRSSLNWSEDRLEAGEIACTDVTPLRLALTDACGGADMQRNWITSFIDAIRSGDLPLGGRLEAAAAAMLIGAFSPDGAARALTLRLTHDGSGIAISAGEAA